MRRVARGATPHVQAADIFVSLRGRLCSAVHVAIQQVRQAFYESFDGYIFDFTGADEITVTIKNCAA